MPDYRLSLHQAAEAPRARDWYAARNPLAARGFLAEIDHAVGRILDSPEAWPRLREEVRRYVLSGYPFSVVYRLQGDEIQIVAMAHHKRRPNYWSSRDTP